MTAYKTVLLGANHPAYNHEQAQHVAAGLLVNPEVSFPAPLFSIAEGTPEELEAIPYTEKTLIARLDEFFKSQSITLQLAFAGPKALAKEYADVGDVEKVREIIESVEVPEDLQALKDQLLALFPEG